MPLFGSNKNTQPDPATHTAPPPGRTSTSSMGHSKGRSGGGLFSSKQRSSSLSSSDLEDNRRSTRSTGGGLFNRNSTKEDPSISDARARVAHAEQSERDADFALQQARTAVREAREHVRRLELEAEADAKAAKIKQKQAQDIGKRAKPLGRKF